MGEEEEARNPEGRGLVELLGDLGFTVSMRPWVAHLIALCLSFLICKVQPVDKHLHSFVVTLTEISEVEKRFAQSYVGQADLHSHCIGITFVMGLEVLLSQMGLCLQLYIPHGVPSLLPVLGGLRAKIFPAGLLVGMTTETKA